MTYVVNNYIIRYLIWLLVYEKMKGGQDFLKPLYKVKILNIFWYNFKSASYFCSEEIGTGWRVGQQNQRVSSTGNILSTAQIQQEFFCDFIVLSAQRCSLHCVIFAFKIWNKSDQCFFEFFCLEWSDHKFWNIIQLKL